MKIGFDAAIVQRFEIEIPNNITEENAYEFACQWLNKNYPHKNFIADNHTLNKPIACEIDYLE